MDIQKQKSLELIEILSILQYINGYYYIRPKILEYESFYIITIEQYFSCWKENEISLFLSSYINENKNILRLYDILLITEYNEYFVDEFNVTEREFINKIKVLKDTEIWKKWMKGWSHLIEKVDRLFTFVFSDKWEMLLSFVEKELHCTIYKIIPCYSFISDYNFDQINRKVNKEAVFFSFVPFNIDELNDWMIKTDYLYGMLQYSIISIIRSLLIKNKYKNNFILDNVELNIYNNMKYYFERRSLYSKEEYIFDQYCSALGIYYIERCFRIEHKGYFKEVKNTGNELLKYFYQLLKLKQNILSKKVIDYVKKFEHTIYVPQNIDNSISEKVLKNSQCSFPNIISTELKNILINNNFFLYGEIHYCKENDIFLSSIVSDLYKLDYSDILLEKAVIYEDILNDYINNNIESIDDNILGDKKLLINSIKRINKELLLANKKAIRIHCIDFYITDDEVQSYVKWLGNKFELDERIKNFIINYNEIQDKEEYFYKNKNIFLGRKYFYSKYLNKLYLYKRKTYSLYKKFSFKKREKFIIGQVLYVLRKNKISKAFIILGQNHTNRNIANKHKTLAHELLKVIKTRKRNVYCTRMLPYKGYLKYNIYSPSRRRFDLGQYASLNDIARLIYEKNTGKIVFTDLSKILKDNNSSIINWLTIDELANGNIEVKKIENGWDGVFSFPNVTYY